MMTYRLLLLLSIFFDSVAHCYADEFTLHSFSRQQLEPKYYSEGANAGDINGDHVLDVVYGPYWFAGPDYTTGHEIYRAVPQNVDGYTDNFFSWIYDFNSDGWNDVFVVGFPGTPAYVYENPKKDGLDAHWKKHQVFDWVSNESPQLVDMFGDKLPELVCTRDGFFGFATIDPREPLSEWTFHPVSERVTDGKFGHGLGIGDVNGDGLQDIIHAHGWYQQPEKGADTSRWEHHPAEFTTSYGGAEMVAYDVDGDGDNDIITGEAAHDFGLSWYEQVSDGDTIGFKRHQIMGAHPSENKYGMLFSELHSLALADIDGDGLKDIVTGKTYWSHHRQSPMWDAGAVVVWFKLVRNEDGVDWIPYTADGEAGIGRQVSIVDVNADSLPDIVVGGMKGAHVLTHRTQQVTQEAWTAMQPKVYTGPKLPSVDGAKATRGPRSTFAANSHRVAGAIEGESLSAQTTGGAAKPQDMSNFRADKWSGDSQLWWTGGKLGDTLILNLPQFTGTFELEIVLTCAKDYGIVQLSIDDQPLGAPIDLYETDVVTTGVLSFSKLNVQGTTHTLSVQIAGSNPQAQRATMCAVDYLRIKTSDGKFVSGL